MRMQRFAVSGLFNTFDHQVPLDGERRLRIIYGPNGFGKTTILRLIDAVFNRNVTFLRRTVFNSLAIYADDGSVLTLRRSVDGETATLQYTMNPRHGKPRSFEDRPTDASYLRHFPLSMIEHEIPFLERVGGRLWKDARTGRVLDMGDVIRMYGDELPIPPSLREIPSPPDWFTEFIGSIPVRLIEAQRLLRLPEESATGRRAVHTQWSATVEAYAADLADAIKSKLAESATLSQSLDRTFPQRLVESTGKHHLSEDELLTRMAAVDTTRHHLIGAGLIEPEPQPAFQVRRGELDDQETSVLSLWVTDVDTKLAIFRELAHKIDLFKDIINQHFLFKEMLIDREQGFSFKTPQAATIPPSSLSSGEQHELILAYELLFKLQPDSLVLIDEPELSLHVAWQLRFLRDLEAIIGLVPFDALIATHSPQIINDRWDLTAKLEGPAGHG